MRKLLNTLYITTPESYLAKDGENVVIRVDDKEKFRIPIHNIEGIVCFGYMGASPGLMHLCAERNVALSFLTEHGRFLCRIQGAVSGNVLLRRKQYRIADNQEQSVSLAKLFVAGKLANCRTVLQRSFREQNPENKSSTLESAIQLLALKQKQVLRTSSSEVLRGVEGEAAQSYFGVFDQLILAQKDDFFMNGRNRRPPKDNVNALLSFIYTLLMHEVRAALESVGLDPCVGFFHTDRPGRASLALDMMEEFRPYLADRLVLSLINRKQINKRGFKGNEAGGVLMTDDTRKEVLTAWQKRKQEEIQHPYLQIAIPVGLLPYAQAMLMARFIRGDIDNYPVFVNK
ncbi:MAG TPA: subtype I-C CRISPR-associated endonuclease Cas1 [Prolixibacteraceae bacterium]|nr:subtype I-C CRISPR-associated endonuclease Cas1 [Prolixibacteraceae bacterium]